MATHEGHYSTFNVMDAKEHWDPHTQEIVTKRLDKAPLQFFTEDEARTLYHLCSILLDDDRKPIIGFVIRHLDSTLHMNIGESQRKATVPKQSVLIRGGLALLDKFCLKEHDLTFKSIKETTKREIVTNLMQGIFPLKDEKQSVPIMDFIQKILTDATAAYYSHPTVWSEIGYAGPAYPRGYVRSELGLTDPWEARRDAE